MKILIDNTGKFFSTELDCGHYVSDDEGNCIIDLDDGCDCDSYMNAN